MGQYQRPFYCRSTGDPTDNSSLNRPEERHVWRSRPQRRRSPMGVIRVYSGAQPAAADNAVTGTLLMEITVDAGAFSHGSATNGLGGTPGKWPTKAFWRYVERSWAGVAGGALLCQPADDGTASTSLARVDMSVGKGSGDSQLPTSTWLLARQSRSMSRPLLCNRGDSYMGIQVSTGLRTACSTQFIQGRAFDGGLLYIYSGTPPASVNDALSGIPFSPNLPERRW